jgi:Holliday junction DNA helicase RuvA
MISALTGELERVDEGHAHLRAGAMLFELLIPAADFGELSSLQGTEVTFHTVFYIEGDASGGNMTPRLIGFIRPEDRAFFELFITVKGIGPKKALRALAEPVSEIAHAIESRDTRFLCKLPQIGKRMAELIVAELAGKATKFATSAQPIRPYATPSRRGVEEQDAIAALIALGERPADAEHLLDRAKHTDPELKTTADFVNAMLRIHSAR